MRRFLKIGFLCASILTGPWLSAQQQALIADNDIHVIDYKDVLYPTDAIGEHIEGVVVIRVKLGNKGEVDAAEVLSGNPRFSQLTANNAKQWQFEPNAQHSAIIVYNFRISGTCHLEARESQTTFYPPNMVAVTACAHPLVP